MTDDKDKIEDAKIVDINEYAAKKWDEAREEDLQKLQEYEQNYILTPLWEALTNIKSSRQAINLSLIHI